MATDSPEIKEKRAGKGSPEVVKKFVPTPERVSQFLERDSKKVTQELASVEGRKAILKELQSHEKDLKKIYPTFDSKELEYQLDLVGDTLAQKEKFLKEVQSPEKQGFFKRAWNRVKGFAKKHPIVTTVLVLAAAAATVAGAAYLAGGFEALLAKLGLSKLTAATQAADPLGTIINGSGPASGSIPGPI